MTDTAPRRRRGGPSGGKETAAVRAAALKDRRKIAGLKRVEVWVRPEHEQDVRDYAQTLREDQPPRPKPRPRTSDFMRTRAC